MELTDKAALQAWHEQQYLDDEPPIVPPVDPLDPQTAVAILMLVCVPAESGAIIWKSALKRLAILAHTLLPEVGAKTLDKVAKELTAAGVDCCRASLSNINVGLYEATGIRRTEKSDRARESYRVRSCEIWKKKAIRNRAKKEAQTVDSQ